MMGKISKEAYQKLALLYLVSRFRNGIFSSYRFQKILYFAFKDSDVFPFMFQHTQNGQYSYDARKLQDSLVWINLLEQRGIDGGERPGAWWTISNNDAAHSLAELFPSVSQDAASVIDSSVENYGYLKGRDLKAKAEADDLLLGTPLGEILLSENLPDYVEVPISEDECEDIELSLNSNFLIAMQKIVEAIETTDFDIENVDQVESIL
jgi:hypothetical protein